MNDMFKQMEELFSKVNKLTKEVKTQNKEIKSLKEQLSEKDKKIEKLETENKKLKLEVDPGFKHFLIIKFYESIGNALFFCQIFRKSLAYILRLWYNKVIKNGGFTNEN
mgnify:CR=1 FL=1